MSEELKRIFRANGSGEHVKEFGACEGVVQGPAGPGWPEVDVRWQPSNLRYAYDPKHLVEVQ